MEENKRRDERKKQGNPNLDERAKRCLRRRAWTCSKFVAICKVERRLIRISFPLLDPSVFGFFFLEDGNFF